MKFLARYGVWHDSPVLQQACESHIAGGSPAATGAAHGNLAARNVALVTQNFGLWGMVQKDADLGNTSSSFARAGGDPFAT